MEDPTESTALHPMRIWGHAPTETDLVIARCTSARIMLAIRCLDRGDIEGARALLEQCDRVLPRPSRQNMLAAQDVLKRRAG